MCLVTLIDSKLNISTFENQIFLFHLDSVIPGKTQNLLTGKTVFTGSPD